MADGLGSLVYNKEVAIMAIGDWLVKRIKDLTRTATSSDLTNGEFVAVDKTDGYTRKMTVANLATWVLGKIKDLSTAITAFRADDVIPVDGPSGSAKMSKDDLLAETAQNTLNSLHTLPNKFEGYLALNDANGTGKFDITTIFENFAGEFIPNQTNAVKDAFYIYQGSLYRAKSDYSGAWDISKFTAFDVARLLKYLSVVTNNEYLFAVVDNSDKFLFGVRWDGSFDWQKGVPDILKKEILNVISLITAESTRAVAAEDTKVDKATGMSLVNSTFASGVSVVTNNEYLFALVDANRNFLFGIRLDGSVDWQKGVPSSIAAFIGSHENDASKAYVDAKCLEVANTASGQVATEKSRAELAEQTLQNQVSSIAPVVINGGTFTNFPDNETLDEHGSVIGIKNIPATVNTKGSCILKSTDSPIDVIVQVNTEYVIRNYFNLGGGTLEIPAGCTLRFDGGKLDNGTIVGDNTKVIYNSTAFGKTVTFSGTWDVPYISSDIIDVTSDGCSELRKMTDLCSDDVYNVVHILPGQYSVAITRNSDHFFNLKSNTKFVVDGEVTVKPNGFEIYDVVFATGKHNIEVTGAGFISGDADYHDYSPNVYGSSHEFGHCLRIYGRDVVVHDLNVKNATGDGFVFGVENLKAYNLVATHCGRQGMTFGNGSKNAIVENCSFDDIYRTSPRYAIDVEPNPNDTDAENLSFKNIRVSRCFGGIALTKAHCVIIENLYIETSTMFVMAKNTSDVIMDGVYGKDNTSSSALQMFEDCDGIILRRLKVETASINNAFTLHLDSLLLESNITLGQYSAITGEPVEGSKMYDYTSHTMKYYDGTSWQTY